MSILDNYVKRRFGVLEENRGTEFGTIGVMDINFEELVKPKSFLVDGKSFKLLCDVCMAVYFIHILIHMEFRNYLGDSIYYFDTVEGLCLLVLLFRIVKSIFEYQFLYFTLVHSLEVLGYCVAIINYVGGMMGVSDNLLFRISNIIRFLPLLKLIKRRIPKEKKFNKFSVAPFKTNSERLVGFLRYLRELD